MGELWDRKMVSGVTAGLEKGAGVGRGGWVGHPPLTPVGGFIGGQ